MRYLTPFLALITMTVCAAAAEPPAVNSLIQEAQQNQPKSSESVQLRPEAAMTAADYAAFRIEEEKSRRYFVLGLLVASVLSHLLVLRFLVSNHQCTASNIVHGSGLVLVVYATVMVVLIARADEQLTAAIGILGAITGYLFGSAGRERRQEPAPRPPDHPPMADRVVPSA